MDNLKLAQNIACYTLKNIGYVEKIILSILFVLEHCLELIDMEDLSPGMMI